MEMSKKDVMSLMASAVAYPPREKIFRDEDKESGEMMIRTGFRPRPRNSSKAVANKKAQGNTRCPMWSIQELSMEAIRFGRQHWIRILDIYIY